MFATRVFLGLFFLLALAGIAVIDDRAIVAADAMPAMLRDAGLTGINGVVITLILAAMIVAATVEMGRLLQAAGCAPVVAWAAIVNVLLLLVPFWAANGSPPGCPTAAALDWQWTVAVLTIGMLGAAFVVARRRNVDGAIRAISTTLLMTVYLGLLASFLVRLRVYGPNTGAWLLLYVLVTVKLADVGGYLTGYAIGRTPLAPWISPKKTVEGLLGGVALSTAFAFAGPWVLAMTMPERFDAATIFPTGWRCAAFGVTMALVGQSGDLLESLMKRDAAVKDSAALIPTFGGVMDLLDSPLVAAPVAYWILLG